MLSIGLWDALVLVLLWLVCGGLSMWLFMRPAVLHYAGEAVISRLIDPDDRTREAIGALLGQMLQANIQTGKTIKDSDGKEVPESLPFLRYCGREIWHYLGMLRKASTGGKSTQIAGELDPLNLVGPRKGQSTTDYLLEQAITRIGPRLEDTITAKIEEVLKKGPGY